MRFRAFSDFRASRDGNFAIQAAILLIPVAVAMGLAIDYGRGSTERSKMQNALDAATVVAVNAPGGVSDAGRAELLQRTYRANGGLGEAYVTQPLTMADEGMTLKTAARQDMDTSFMRLVGRNSVSIGAKSAVRKDMQLLRLEFGLVQVTGIWDKTVTLLGRVSETAPYQPLAQMVYKYKGSRQPIKDGVGLTTLSEMTPKGWADKASIDCRQARTMSDCQKTGSSADIDVSDMQDIYLEMRTTYTDSEGKKWYDKFKIPLIVASNDPKMSDRMFVAGVQQPKGVAVNMMRAAGCGGVRQQRWEDGGGWEGARNAWEGTDFHYQIEGTCGSGKNGVPIFTQ